MNVLVSCVTSTACLNDESFIIWKIVNEVTNFYRDMCSQDWAEMGC